MVIDISKIDWGSPDPIIDSEGKVHVLYKTTYTVTGQIYVGVHSYKGGKNPSRVDEYRGKGAFIRKLPKELFRKLVRENLLYFKDKEDAYRAESFIVTQEFIESDKTLNRLLGGDHSGWKGERSPHYKKFVSEETRSKLSELRKGELNSNYGKRWCEEKRKLASLSRAGKGLSGENPNSKIWKIENVLSGEVISIKSIIPLVEESGFNYRKVYRILHKGDLLIGKYKLLK